MLSKCASDDGVPNASGVMHQHFNYVCLSTKAVHLELVSVLVLSTEEFLATFSRLRSRRGTCSEVCFHNGTNIVGASR